MEKSYVMMVTNDQYELPILPPMHVNELAKIIGCTPCTIFKAIQRNSFRGPRKFIRVLIDDD